MLQKHILLLPLILFTILLSLPSFATPMRKIPRARELPALEQLETAIFKQAGLDPEKIKQWQHGARWSAALPRIQIGWESKILNQNTTIIQDNISVTNSGITIGPESNRINADIENNRDFEVKAVWALDELLFNRDQISISREARDLFFVRTQIIQALHQAYYDLKSLLLKTEQNRSLLKDPYMSLQIEQKITQLNSLTGGEFNRLLKHSRS